MFFQNIVSFLIQIIIPIYKCIVIVIALQFNDRMDHEVNLFNSGTEIDGGGKLQPNKE